MEAFVKQASVIARILCGPGQAASYQNPRSLEKSGERVRRQGTDGPADLDASQHRGALKSEPHVRRKQDVPRAMLIGLLRPTSGGLTVSGSPPLITN
jgi:hypothetical protein